MADQLINKRRLYVTFATRFPQLGEGCDRTRISRDSERDGRDLLKLAEVAG
jgi:hypothetical protein